VSTASAALIVFAVSLLDTIFKSVSLTLRCISKPRLVFWSAVAAGGLGLTKRSSKLSFRAEVVAQHVNSFVERRIVRPLTK
jgi:hypothetical protein